ncbi:hypothetical protein NP233_g10875 [Leucocoprinus birnbaumii]|uniref:Uncharacterized protein n=1 Tax=Leucocoprinus birnbaumii TaxID=56174 RepID=A0AAD5VNH0_9AGAR|nr:hypothetical protein NP233_g10875 [Leucocoprinus birnbaumii]
MSSEEIEAAMYESLEPNSERKKLPSRISFTHSVLLFHLQHGYTDPFSDPGEGEDVKNHPFETEKAEEVDNDDSAIIRGQITVTLDEVMADPSRTRVFAVFMNSHVTRLIRADQAGIVVTEAMYYHTQSMHLITFLRGIALILINQDKHHKLGFDITADWTAVDGTDNLVWVSTEEGNFFKFKLSQ